MSQGECNPTKWRVYSNYTNCPRNDDCILRSLFGHLIVGSLIEVSGTIDSIVVVKSDVRIGLEFGMTDRSHGLVNKAVINCNRYNRIPMLCGQVVLVQEPNV